MLNHLVKEAQELYTAANPTDPSCVEYDRILKIVEKLLQNKNYLEKGFDLRWHIYYLRAEYELALNDLDSLIKIDPFARNSFYNRGFLKNQLKDYKAALVDFEEANRLAIQAGDDDLIDAVEHYIIELKEGFSND